MTQFQDIKLYKASGQNKHS